MAYYTGQCSSYQHLADILVEKCQQHGWAWQDNILSKDDLFVKVMVQNQPASNYYGVLQHGITITGGTAQHGSNLVNPSNSVRLGRTVWNEHNPNYFPVNYHLFVFADEVYLVMKFEVDKFYYLAFGKSHLIKGTQGNGLWLSATACNNAYYAYSAIEHMRIMSNDGGEGGGNNRSPVAPFFNRNQWYDGWSNSIICHGLDNTLWSSGTSRAYATFEPLIDRLPTAHFADSPLLPYNIYLERPENKISLITQFANARFLRIDNHEPEQIITLGHERWIVFPFYRKDLQERNGTITRYDHTGTFGWAIRYEG